MNMPTSDPEITSLTHFLQQWLSIQKDYMQEHEPMFMMLTGIFSTFTQKPISTKKEIIFLQFKILLEFGMIQRMTLTIICFNTFQLSQKLQTQVLILPFYLNLKVVFQIQRMRCFFGFLLSKRLRMQFSKLNLGRQLVIMVFRRLFITMDIVGNEVTSMVQHFFNHKFMLKSINYTQQVLIPKTLHPQTPNDYRPISLCNVSYKIISKIIANRLKPLLHMLITPTKCAYISGRHIQNNIVIAHEIIHSMKKRRKGKVSYMGLKLDMSKAFDKLEWQFLFDILLCLGFHQDWVQMVQLQQQISLSYQWKAFCVFYSNERNSTR